MAAGQLFRSSGFVLVFLTYFYIYAGLLPSNGDINFCSRTSLRIGVQELQTELLFSSQVPAPLWQRRRHLEAKGYFCSRQSHYPNSTSAFSSFVYRPAEIFTSTRVLQLLSNKAAIRELIILRSDILMFPLSRTAITFCLSKTRSYRMNSMCSHYRKPG